jgi:hypothetical protein
MTPAQDLSLYHWPYPVFVFLCPPGMRNTSDINKWPEEGHGEKPSLMSPVTLSRFATDDHGAQ